MDRGRSKLTHGSMARIDILLTVFNGEPFLARTLDSVLAQQFTEWRLIAVDDCSTDGTPAILADYARRDDRILVVRGEHKGIAAAANIGLAHVTAPLVARLDGDDIAVPERLQVQYDFLMQHPEILAVGSDVMLIDENDKPLRRRKAPVGWQKIHDILRTRNCMCHPSSIIRTEALQRIGGYRPKFRNSLDYDLWLRISEIGQIDNIPQDLLLYRRHAAQVSGSANTHRQTIYSVGAITDYFLRKYCPGSPETLIDEANNDDLALKLAAVYQAAPSASDIQCLNRHAIRLQRYAKALSPSARQTLRQIAEPHFSPKQRLKSWTYATLRRFGFR